MKTLLTASGLEPDPESLRGVYRWLQHEPLGVTEVRVIEGGRGVVGMGFFDNEEAFVRACVHGNQGGNVYVGIQPRARYLFERAPNSLRRLGAGAAKGDVAAIVGTVIDLDPDRPKGAPSTEGELALTLEVAERACAWFVAQGLQRPLRMLSGNGIQLWCAIDPLVIGTDVHQADVETRMRELEAELRKEVQSAKVRVDSIFDSPRIIKAIGSVSVKGEHSIERPHRVSAPLDGFERVNDSALRERLLAPAQPALQLAAPEDGPAWTAPQRTAPAVSATGAVERDEAGEIRWSEPVPMCGPVRRLWQEGYTADRSVAIFTMVRFLMSKALPLGDIITLVTEWDRRGLGKLVGRDAAAEITRCYEKVQASLPADGLVAPPCHAIQKMGYCLVNTDPEVRCELYDSHFDLDAAIDAIPKSVPAADVPALLEKLFEVLRFKPKVVHSMYYGRIASSLGLRKKEVERAFHRSWPEKTVRLEHDEAGSAGTAPGAIPPIDGEVYEDLGCYYVPDGESRRIISSFSLTVTHRQRTPAGTTFFCKATTDAGDVVEDVRLPAQAFYTKRDLVRALRVYDLQWTGSDNNVQGLLRALVTQHAPAITATSQVGEHVVEGERLWLAPGVAMNARGLVAQGNGVFIQDGASLHERVAYREASDEDFERVASTVFRWLPVLNTPDVVLPMLGWFFATPMKPRLMEELRCFPLLFLAGSSGSGKTTMVTSAFWPLFGFVETYPFSATETAFTLTKLLSSTNAAPVFIDEYKPYDMPRRSLDLLHRFLRRIYRGETEERGHQNLTTTTYRLDAPVCVAGESRPAETALLERMLPVSPDKTKTRSDPAHAEALATLQATDLGAFTTRYLRWCLGRDLGPDLEVARAVWSSIRGDREVPSRIADNLVVMLLGIHLFEQFALACGYQDLPEDLGVDVAIEAILDDLLESGDSVKTALDQFLEMLGVMAVQGELRHRVHYVFRDGQLCIHLPSAYDAFRGHCRRVDFDGEVIDQRSLKRMVKENLQRDGYVVADGERVYFQKGCDRRRAVVIDLARTELISADDFPARDEGGEEVGWAGY